MKRIILLSLSFMLVATGCLAGSKVTLREDAETFTMDNGIVTARVSKVTGDLVSLIYMGEDLFATGLDPNLQIKASEGSDNAANPNWKSPTIKGKGHGYWSHDAQGVLGSAPAVPTVTIDPAGNGGKRAEVSVKGISNGRRMGTGAGVDASKGDVPVDIDIRYALEEGASGVYTYCIFNHTAEYPAGSFGEARYCAKLNDSFDWMSVDENVDFHYPKDHNAGDKYVYTAVQSKNPAFGWSSTTKNYGLFFINPSMEYMSGGPTKVEFMGHRNTTAVAEPCVLNYWRSSHYGGAEVKLAAGEVWSKVIGPFFIYANSGADHAAIYADARAQAAREAAKWPYRWVDAAEYAKPSERSTVSGRLVINDPAVSRLDNLHVGLAASGYFWQRDAKNYEFWTVGSSDGKFSIPDVVAGNYTLYAFADGVLGEFVKTDIVVAKGGKLKLGKLRWTPVRRGEPIFEIGVPNRNGSEFEYGQDGFRDPEIVLKYAKLNPDDVTYTVGESDWSRDWPYLHVPHNENPDAKVLPFFGIRSDGRATPYRINFEMKSAPESGTAVLRFGICGTAAQELGVTVNGTDAGTLTLQKTGDGVITRHGSHGIWYETEFQFDAALLHQGSNSIVLTMPAGSLNNGILYDYIRLEL